MHSHDLQVGESLVTTYQHGCTYFKLCSHAELSSRLTVVFNDLANTNSMEVEWARGLPPAAEAAACLAKRRIEMQAPRSFNQASVAIGALPSQAHFACLLQKMHLSCPLMLG